jgi:3-oxoacyl-[acyl-carrier-protein] synthase II
MKKIRRIVITGMGAITPLGLSMNETWAGLCLGKSGIDTISLFDASDLPIRIAGEIKGFDPLNFMDKRTARRMSRTSQLALAASRMAVDDARIDPGAYADTFGICVGTGVGCLDKIIAGVQSIAESQTRVEPFGVISSLGNTPSALICSQYKINGPSSTVVTACASGIQAIGEAAEQIRRGWADIMLCGGVDALVLRVSFLGFSAMGLMSCNNEEPALASRPFSVDRDGLVLSEGSAFFVLEELEHAINRKANIVGELLGYSATTDSASLFLPDQSGEKAALAMKQAILRSELQPHAIQYIHAHGTATKANDGSETRAIKSVFGPKAYTIPISSTKSMIGHTMGASGAIGVAVGLKVINENIIPPTINLNNPDPECDLDYVPNKARKAKVNKVLVNAFGLGGQNACLVLSEI